MFKQLCLFNCITIIIIIKIEIFIFNSNNK